MTKKWLAGIAAAALVVAPGVALADTNGQVKVTVASLDAEDDGNKESAIALSGAVVTDLGSSGWRLQFNGVGASMDHSGHNDDFSQYEAHATYDFGNFSLGGFTGHFMRTEDGYWEFGAEAGLTMGRFGVTATAATLSSTTDGGEDGSNFGVNGAFAVTDNIRISAHGSWSDFGFDNDVDSYGLGANFALPNGMGIGVGWRTSDTLFDGQVDAIGVSFGWNFGEGEHGRIMPGAAGLVPDAIATQ